MDFTSSNYYCGVLPVIFYFSVGKRKSAVNHWCISLIYIFTWLFMLVWPFGYLFYFIGIIQYHCYLFCCSNYSSFGHWELFWGWFLCPFDIVPPFLAWLWTLFFFPQYMILQAHLVFFQRILISFIREWYLEAQPWALKLCLLLLEHHCF